MARKYYEVEFGHEENNLNADLSDTYSICIIAEHHPTIKEAEDFCKTDIDRLGYERVTNIIEVDSEEAHTFFDMENEENFPVLK